MTTTYLHRVLLGIPANKRAAVITWWNNNLDGGQGTNTWSVGLSANGQAPASFYWCSTALTNAQIKLLVQQLCTMASVTFPAGWDSFTKPQMITWIQDNAAAIQSGAGVRVVRDDNDGAWSDPTAMLTAQGVQRITS